ncbi:transient receptor potential cation channel subfamily M member 6-like [Ruditapes philippinarum]|uniref:transient receptor potential cation channel subfamily M member 6-like n=1 Tax=Ruditapes philippinarum TaxID=129788 RepID=UPI00295A609C|nr:transient receptor potential cation channel subfamily M member 6-like [Ruditapes philippinarum]XP_060598130.1 transient receptor potential cation channel subfamily M member 6-like [Ruditapes philippinarum]
MSAAPESPQSYASRGRKVSRQVSGIDKTSQCSSMNYSIHHEESIEKILLEKGDDSFHLPTHTLISPIAQSIPTPTANHKKSISGRFTVSPAQNIPSVSFKPKNETGTPPKSESSASQSLIETEMQFKMSDTSLSHIDEKAQNADQKKPLLQDSIELGQFERKDSIGSVNEGGVPGCAIDYLTVEENQRTIQSNFSVNTQDSAIFEHAPLQCGNIRFVKDTVDLIYEPKKHYLCVGYDTEMPAVTEFMSRYWGKKNPNIVLSVISSEESYKPWKSQRLKDDFQKGILKAANTTDMWIITNGINAGIPKVIGDAIKEYNIEQQNTRLIANPLLTSSEHGTRRLTAIGIVPKDLVPYGMYFDGTEGVQITNYGGKSHANIYELNPEHTHFIIAEEDGREFNAGNLRCMIEQQFSHKVVKRRRAFRLMSIGSDSETDNVEKKQIDLDNFIPVVGLLVQGSPKNIDHVLFYIQNKMPVVILKGSGGLADMIGFVHEEIQEKADSDPDYEEHFLKPEVIKMITRMYGSFMEENDLDKFVLRDKIIQCVKMANEGDGDHSFMTIVNMKGWGWSMRDLDKYILRALFKSEKPDGKGQMEQLQNDLQLTIDWNRPDLAWEIFQQDFTKVRIDKKMFEKALLQKDREEFIDLFLSQGVKVHKFLNHKKLKHLFDKAEDREFFLNVCMEGVLGITIV